MKIDIPRENYPTVEQVQQVNALMGDLGISLIDVEIFDAVERRHEDGDLKEGTTLAEAYDAACAAGPDDSIAEHYWNTVQDAVYDALDEADLLVEED